MEQLLQTQVGVGFLAVWIIQKLKAAGWLKFINDDTGKLNRFLSALAAAAVTAGITVHYDPTGGALTVAGLTLANSMSFLATLLSQGAIQEVLYQVGFKAPKTATSLIASESVLVPPPGTATEAKQ
jgi:hypothetical protein